MKKNVVFRLIRKFALPHFVYAWYYLKAPNSGCWGRSLDRSPQKCQGTEPRYLDNGDREQNLVVGCAWTCHTSNCGHSSFIAKWLRWFKLFGKEMKACWGGWWWHPIKWLINQFAKQVCSPGLLNSVYADSKSHYWACNPSELAHS